MRSGRIRALMALAAVVASDAVPDPSTRAAEDAQIPYLVEFREGQPVLQNNESWLARHPSVPIASRATQLPARDGPEAPTRALFLCLFGIPGVHRGKARSVLKWPEKTVSAVAVAEAAASHLEHVILPAERLGLGVRVFAHAWGHESSAVARAVDGSYGGRLVASTHEPFAHPDPFISMVLSAKASLDLAQPYLQASSPPPDAYPLHPTPAQKEHNATTAARAGIGLGVASHSELLHVDNPGSYLPGHPVGRPVGPAGRRLSAFRGPRAARGKRGERGSPGEDYYAAVVERGGFGRGRGHDIAGVSVGAGARGVRARVSGAYNAVEHAVVVLMRHDCFWLRDFAVAGLRLPKGAVVTATW